jgi:hypothetical protein
MQNLDTWVAFLTLAALAYYVLPKKIRTGIAGAGRASLGLLLGMVRHDSARPASSTRVISRPSRSARRRSVQQFKARSRVQNEVRPRSEHQDAERSSVQRSASSVQRSAVQPLDRPVSMVELQQLGEALRLKFAGEERTKQAAIERAFGITKGGGDEWRRASLLYDQAMQRSSAAPAREVETA